MNRPMILATNGWYPYKKNQCIKEIESYIDNNLTIDIAIPVSCIVPHAGWYFCGRWIINVIRLLNSKRPDIKNIFIFGGHMNQHDLPILESFDNAETPLGLLENNKEVIDFLKSEKIKKTEYRPDNTIEIIIPPVKYYFPDVKITAIYLPPNEDSIHLVKKIYNKYSSDSIFISSTDLTHYGPNYNLFHDDDSLSGIEWVKKVNDKKYIDLLLGLEDMNSVLHALKYHSACSSGASLGAVTAAKLAGKTKGEMVGYSTSYDVRKDESFVGYAGIIY